MNEEKELFDLINVPFSITFAGKEYTVRKANLEKAVLYQARLRQLAQDKDLAIDAKIAAYCLYLVLHDADSSITEEFVMQNATGSLNVMDWLIKLGFMTPQKDLSKTTK